jgi:hypothetical protein
MRVRVSEPKLLGDLCDYLSRQGYVCQEAAGDQAHVLMPGAHSSFEAATLLLAQIEGWRETHEPVEVELRLETPD